MSHAPRTKPLILRAVSRMSPGGVQRGILATLGRADRERFDYAVLCYKKEGPWAGQVRELGIPLYLQKTLPPWHPLQIMRLARLIRRIAPDLIHVHMAPTVIPIVTAARLAGVKHYLIHHHNYYDRHWAAQNALLRQWEWALTRRAGALVAVSQAVARTTIECSGISPERVVTIPNGIDYQKFMDAAPRDPRPEWGLPPGTPLVVHVARYLDTKRIEDFITAGALLARRWADAPQGADEGPDRGPRPAFIVIGGGAQEFHERYARQIRELGAEASVILAGTRDDVPAILRSAQVGALASEMEGFGQVIWEYIAAGLAVAATDLPPVAEMVTHDQEVLLSPPRQPEALADNIERLLRSPALAARLVEQGQRRMKNYSWQAAVRGYEDVYERLLRVQT